MKRSEVSRKRFWSLMAPIIGAIIVVIAAFIFFSPPASTSESCEALPGHVETMLEIQANRLEGTELLAEQQDELNEVDLYRLNDLLDTWEWEFNDELALYQVAERECRG